MSTNAVDYLNGCGKCRKNTFWIMRSTSSVPLEISEQILFAFVIQVLYLKDKGSDWSRPLIIARDTALYCSCEYVFSFAEVMRPWEMVEQGLLHTGGQGKDLIDRV